MPSAGGLHPIHLICIGDEPGAPRLYDNRRHAFLHLSSSVDVYVRNAADIEALLGRTTGCTIRFVADLAKAQAAYTAPESLVMRDAGALLATMCFYAEWLGMAARPLGFLGDDLVPALGFPAGRFVGVGGLQLTGVQAPSSSR